MIRAVIFDLDGTLLDTKRDLASAHNYILRRFGLPERALEDFGQIVGGGIIEAIRRAAPPGTPEETIMELNKLYQSYYPDHCTEQTAPYPGMVETVEKLAEAGIALAVFTNKTEPTAIKLVDHYFPGIKFEFIWGNDGSRPLKPATDAAFAAQRILGFEMSEIAYVGDIGSDMAFARNAGLVAVGAAWGFRGREELEASGAQIICGEPAELLKLL